MKPGGLMFALVFILPFIANSIFVHGTYLEVVIIVIEYVILFSSFLILILEKKIFLNKYLFFSILICFLYLLTIESGYTQLISLFLVYLIFGNGKVQPDHYKVVMYTYATFCFIFFFIHFFGIYKFPIKSSNLLKGDSVQLGFRNINTFAFYLSQAILMAYVLNKKLFFTLLIGLLIVSTYYTKTRTPVVAVLIGLIVNLFYLKNNLLSRITVNLGFILTLLCGFLFVTLSSLLAEINIQIYGVDFTLNELSSYRLYIYNSYLEKFTFWDWLFGKPETDLIDSIYFFFVTKFGLFFSLLIGVFIVKKFVSLTLRIHVVVLFCFFVFSIFEMPISPFSFSTFYVMTILFDNNLRVSNPDNPKA